MKMLLAIIAAVFGAETETNRGPVYTPVKAGPGAQQNGPNSVVVTYEMPSGTEVHDIRAEGIGGGPDRR